MIPADVTQKIRRIYSTLSKSHKKIASAVLYEYEKVSEMTSSMLARYVNVSQSTVVRFACLLGFEGYNEFQNAVLEFAMRRYTLNQRIDVTKRKISRRDIIEDVMEADIQKIRHTQKMLNKKAFFKAVDRIINAKTIYVTGARGSEAIAKMLQYNLALIFDNVKFVVPSSTAEVFEQMYSIGEGDVLIAFCYPRYSSKIVDAIKYAQNAGAEVILFTDTETSPPGQYATILLVAELENASFMDSLVAPLSVINAIIVEITNRCEGVIRRRFDKLERVWDEYNVYTKGK